MTTKADGRRIDASPTKDFFVHMLVRDISLVPAIIDLVDNSVDGARRIRGEGDYKGLWVRLEVEDEKFRIADNCGGIELDMAENYAFRFGRPAGMELTPHSIGQFGVGMKRSLFKIGDFFRISSKARSSSFVVEVDVQDWLSDDKWEFSFESAASGEDRRIGSRGTTIEVTNLHTGVRRAFSGGTFESSLRDELESIHRNNIARGLAITLNQIPIEARLAELLTSTKIKPAHKTLTFEDPKVTVKLFAGIGESFPSEAGWYVFCNGRLILEADQTFTTGWGEGGERTLPRYHNQYSRFRGFVLFDSDDPGALPWTTTKTDVDFDSPLYRNARTEMLKLGRPVITFLNRLDKEKDEHGHAEGPLTKAVDAAKAKDVTKIARSGAFVAPESKQKKSATPMARITYQRPLKKVEEAAKRLKVKTNRDVGEKTFDYFYGREVDES